MSDHYKYVGAPLPGSAFAGGTIDAKPKTEPFTFGLDFSAIDDFITAARSAQVTKSLNADDIQYLAATVKDLEKAARKINDARMILSSIEGRATYDTRRVTADFALAIKTKMKFIAFGRKRDQEAAAKRKAEADEAAKIRKVNVEQLTAAGVSAQDAGSIVDQINKVFPGAGFQTVRFSGADFLPG